ncbi:hypothetical protein GCM10020295_38940 [Streptomyces cinereospinus]
MNHRLDGQSSEGLDSDELALRRMLHHAVQDIEPREGTLEHLRQAVPARRARKRQAAVGMAAAALFVCTAVPALVHVSNATGPDADPSIAGHGAQAQGGAGEGRSTEGAGSTEAGPTAAAREPGQDGAEKDDEDAGPTPGGGVVDDGTDDVYPSATSAVAAPVCTAAQLGSAGADAAGDGTVYGTFRIVNVSTAGCTVGGAGTVTPLAQGAADATRISVAAHTAGDAAAACPTRPRRSRSWCWSRAGPTRCGSPGCPPRPVRPSPAVTTAARPAARRPTRRPRTTPAPRRRAAPPAATRARRRS